MDAVDALLEQLWQMIAPYFEEAVALLQRVFEGTSTQLMLGLIIGAVLGAVFSRLIRGLLTGLLVLSIAVITIRLLEIPLPGLT
jgi:hypothetical protein